MTWLLPDVECDKCSTALTHDDPAWAVLIIDGQPTPLCVECAVAAGFTRDGVRPTAPTRKVT